MYILQHDEGKCTSQREPLSQGGARQDLRVPPLPPVASPGPPVHGLGSVGCSSLRPLSLPSVLQSVPSEATSSKLASAVQF